MIKKPLIVEYLKYLYIYNFPFIYSMHVSSIIIKKYIYYFLRFIFVYKYIHSVKDKLQPHYFFKPQYYLFRHNVWFLYTYYIHIFFIYIIQIKT